MKKLGTTLVQSQLEDVKSSIRMDMQIAPSDIMNLSIDSLAKKLACACADGIVRIFTLINNKLTSQINTIQKGEQKLPAMSVKWLLHQNQQILISAKAGGGISLLHQKGQLLYTIPQPNNYTNSVDSGPKGQMFTSAGKDCVVRVYDTQKKVMIVDLYGVDWHRSGHNNRLFCVKFIDQNRIISGGWDHNVHLWDIRERKSSGCIYGAKICGQTLDYKDDMVLTGAHRPQQPLQIWDYSTCKLINSFQWDEKNKRGAFVFGTKFGQSLDQTIIAAASGVNQRHKQLAILKLPSAPYCVDISKKGPRWAAGMAGGGLLIVDTKSRYMIQQELD